MTFVSKLSPEQWTEARRLRAEGETFASLGRRFDVTSSTIAKRAHKEGWDAKPGAPAVKPAARTAAARSAKAQQPSPDTLETRRRLARHLYGYLDIRIRMMESHMKKESDAAKRSCPSSPAPPSPSPAGSRPRMAVSDPPGLTPWPY